MLIGSRSTMFISTDSEYAGLKFTAVDAGATVKMYKTGGRPPDVNLEYSTNGMKWLPFIVNTTTITLLKVGSYVYIRANASGNSNFANSGSYSYNYFKFTGRIAASGNIMSLLDNTLQQTTLQSWYTFACLFSDCTSLVQVPELPATVLTNGCYSGMFSGCTSLVQAPALPAISLPNGCYGNMFRNCTSLSSTPVLPATIFGVNCCNYMFQNCTSLVQASTLSAIILAQTCFKQMFSGCTSLVQAPELLATTLANGCYSEMFYNCTSLSTIPALPATTLAQSCYSSMFRGCTSLTQAPKILATALASNCYYGMFQNCTSLTQAPELPATTLAQNCYSSMFRGCTSLTQAPKILATALASNCYNSMFSGCTSLTQAPELPATTLAYGCYQGMFYGCTSLTQAPALPATTLANYCYYSMFNNCTHLSSIHVSFKNWGYSDNWMSNVAQSGKFYCSEDLSVIFGPSNIPQNWEIENTPTMFTARTYGDYTKTGVYSAVPIDSSDPIVIDWGDGNVENISGNVSQKIHEYSTEGKHQVKMFNANLIEITHGDNGQYIWSGISGSQTMFTLNSIDAFDPRISVIPYGAFTDTYGMESFVIPSTITSIGTYSFTNGLATSVSIPSSIVDWQNGGQFWGLSCLTCVNIENGIRSIPRVLFSDCSSLQHIEFPSSITSFGNHVFQRATSLKDVVFNSNAALNRGFFYYCKQLTSVNTLSSQTSIKEYTFYYCENILSADFTSALTSIDQYAFYCCKKLSSVGDLASVRSIGKYAFYLCQALSGFGAMSALTSIGTYAFASCPALSSMQLSANNIKYLENGTFSGCTNLANILLPSTLLGIGNNAFYGCGRLTSLDIPSGVLSIGSQAFYNCNQMLSIAIPESVSSVGAHAFYTTSISDILFCGKTDEEVSGMANYPWGITTDKLSIIHGDTSLVTVKYANGTLSSIRAKDIVASSSIPNINNAIKVEFSSTVKTISAHAFYGCSSLQCVVVPKNVEYIGADAFYGCTSLSSLKFNNRAMDNIKQMENYCWGLSDASVIEGNVGTIALHNDGTLSAYGIGETIHYGDILRKNDVVAISVDDITQVIATSAFAEFGSMSSISLPNSIELIDNYAFAGCSSLTGINVPDSTLSLGIGAFYSCSNASAIALPSTLVSIGQRAFYNSGITSITIPYSVVSIGTRIFEQCTKLLSAWIFGRIEVFSAGTFRNSSSLQYVHVPDTVEGFTNQVFGGCVSLSCLDVDRLVAPTATNTSFGSIHSTYAGANSVGSNILRVPDGATGYDAGSWLSVLQDQSKCGFSIQYGLERDKTLTYIKFADGTLCSYWWTGKLDEQKEIEYGIWDETHGDWAMSIAHIDIGNALSSIAEWELWACVDLTCINIPSSIVEIEEWAFSDCTALPSVLIPSSVSAVGDGTFSGCTSLSLIVVEGKTQPEAAALLNGTEYPNGCTIEVRP